MFSDNACTPASPATMVQRAGIQLVAGRIGPRRDRFGYLVRVTYRRYRVRRASCGGNFRSNDQNLWMSPDEVA